MQFKLVHAATSGIVIALVLSLVLVPSIWEMTAYPQIEPVLTLEEKGGRVAGENLDGETPPSPSDTFGGEPSPPPKIEATIITAASAVVVVLVLLSFLVVRRIEE
jgi:hypothetical protein